MNQAIKQRELQNCGTVKTLMMLLVVVGHCATACSGKGWFTVAPESRSAVLSFISSFTGMYHVQTFLFVSGYLFYYLRYELGRYSDISEFVKKKSLRLLAPFLFACLWAIPAYIYFFKPELSVFIKKFVICENPAQLWFLLALFWIYIAFYFLSRLLDKFDFFKRMSLVTAVILLAGFCVLSLGNYVIYKFVKINLFSVLTGLRYFPLFFAGFIFRKFDFEKLNKFSIPLLIFSAAATVIYNRFAHGTVETLLQVPLWILNSTAMFIFITKYVNLKGRLFEIFKKHNFTVYLLHQQLIYVIIYLISRFWKVYPYPSFFICLAGSLVISVALSALFAKFRLTSTILGLKAENKQ